MGILRLGHVEVKVTDLDRAARFYTGVVGLEETARSHGHRYLRAPAERDHHSILLSHAPVSGVGHIGWKTADADDLASCETWLERTGCAPQRVPADTELGLGAGIRFDAPSGHAMELYHHVRKVDQDRWSAPQDPQGIAPIRLEHVALTAADVDGLSEFLQRVLGFRVTERIVEPYGRSRVLHLERSHQAVDVAVHRGSDGGLLHLGLRIPGAEGMARVAAALRADDLSGASSPDAGSAVTFADPCGNRIAVSTEQRRVDPDDAPVVRPSPEPARNGVYASGTAEPIERSVEVLLIRHGQTQSYAADAGLTQLGRDQAYDKGVLLAKRLGGNASVQLPHAPTARAEETAVALREGLLHGIAELGTPAVVVGNPAASEWFGNLRVWADGAALDPTQAYAPYQEAMSATHGDGAAPGWTVEMRRWAAIHAAGGDPIAYWLTHPLQYFEPAAAVVRRFWHGIARLIQGADLQDRLFVSTHSACIRAVATAAFGYDPGEPLNVEDVLIRVVPERQEAVVGYRGRSVRQRLPVTQSAPWHVDEHTYTL